MAKRKRLSPALPPAPPRRPEHKALIGWVALRARAPIAQVAGEASAQAALKEVTDEMRRPGPRGAWCEPAARAGRRRPSGA